MARNRILFETGLPPRYYIPPEDVRGEALVPSDKHTQCPYKGVASYYSVGERVENLVWLDGEMQERPQTQWS